MILKNMNRLEKMEREGGREREREREGERGRERDGGDGPLTVSAGGSWAATAQAISWGIPQMQNRDVNESWEKILEFKFYLKKY